MRGGGVGFCFNLYFICLKDLFIIYYYIYIDFNMYNMFKYDLIIV